MVKKYKPLRKSRKNTSGRPSKAKRDSMKKNVHKKKVGRPKAKPNYSYRLSALNPKSPKQLPETAQTIKGLTLRQLLRGTPKLMINNAIEVEIIDFKVVKTKSGMPAVQAKCTSYDPWRPSKVQRPHKVFIIGAEKDKQGNISTKSVNKHRKVITSCNCENYVFTWEYANAAHGASRIVYCNGQPPVMTNPGLAFGLCKHLVAVARHIITKDI